MIQLRDVLGSLLQEDFETFGDWINDLILSIEDVQLKLLESQVWIEGSLGFLDLLQSTCNELLVDRANTRKINC